MDTFDFGSRVPIAEMEGDVFWTIRVNGAPSISVL